MKPFSQNIITQSIFNFPKLISDKLSFLSQNDAHTCTLALRERERVPPFDKVTAGVKPVILREFNMPDDKSPTSRLILLRNKNQFNIIYTWKKMKR